MRLVRYERNPLLSPLARSRWENVGVTNPCPWQEGRTFRMFYRAIGDDAAERMHLGVAAGSDGIAYERTADVPAFGPSADGFDAGGILDARFVRIGGLHILSYVTRLVPPREAPNLPADAPAAVRANVRRGAIALAGDLRHWHRLGPVTDPSRDTGQIVLFPERVDGEYLLIHGSSPATGGISTLGASFSEDLLTWDEDHALLGPVHEWEAGGLLAGPPPVRTSEGWVFLYVGIDLGGVHHIGAALLDARDPLKVVSRLATPLLEPEAIYEKNGRLPKCLLPTGALVRDEKLLVFYGGAETYVCLATMRLGELVGGLLEQESRP